jgi:hypothetical protein
MSTGIYRNVSGQRTIIAGRSSNEVLSADSTGLIDISQYRLLFGFSLLYTDRVPFELLVSAALLRRESCGGGGKLVFLSMTTII